MTLFKYRSLSNPEHACDLLINQRLHCSRYADLNDPFEGIFSAIMHISPEERMKGLPCMWLPETLSVPKCIDDLLYKEKDTIRVCSLSSSSEDVRLWSHYADSHKGIAVEIDVSDLDYCIEQVNYSDNLPSYPYTILGLPFPKEVLTKKTTHWKYEAEYRLFHHEEYFDISGRIRTIYLGTRISNMHRQIIERICPSSCTLIETELDHNAVLIRKKRNT